MEQLRTFKSGVQQSLTPIYAMSEKHKVMAWEFMQIMMKTLSETLGSSVTGVYPVAYAEKPLPRRHHVATQTAIPSEETPKKPPSDPDEDDAIPSTVRSRRRRKPIKFIDSDSDEDDGKKAKPPSPKKRNTVKKEQPKKSTTQKSPAVKPSLKVDSPTDVPNKIKTRSKSTGPTPTATAVPEEQDVTPNEKNKETKSTTEESPDEVPEPSVSQPANDDIIDKTDNPTEKDSMNSGGNELKDDSNMTGDSEAKDVGNDDGDDVTQLDEENPPDDAGKKPKKHGRPSSGRTSFTCTICEKTLSTPGNLTVHMRSHSQEKRHNCSKCDKKFITRSNLIRHERTHIGDKPFACEVCGKRYTEKKSVTVHMRQHTGEKPFVDSDNEKSDVPLMLSSYEDTVNGSHLTEEVVVTDNSTETIENEYLALMKQCEEDCCTRLGKKLYHCPFCSIENIKPCRRSKMLNHLDSHWKNRLTVDGVSVTRCCKKGDGHNENGHFHCPRCDIVIKRRGHFLEHLKRNNCSLKFLRHRKKRSSKEDHMTINHRNPDYFIDHKMSIFHVKEEVINENEYPMEDIMAHIKDPFNKDHIKEDCIEHTQDPSNKDHIEEDNIISEDDTQDPSNKDHIEEDNIIRDNDTQDPSNKDHIEEDNVMKENDIQDTSNKDCNEQGQFYEDFAMMAISTTESELFELLKSCEESCCIQSTRKRYHCPLCPINEFKPNIRRSAVIKHLKSHWKKRITVEGVHVFRCFNKDNGHHTDGHFHCPRCASVLKRRDHFRAHLKECCKKGNKKKICLKMKSSVKEVKEKEKIYRCDQCGKGFTQSGILKSHMHTHTGWKGHICDICGRSFRQKSQLKMHIMRHTKTKRHPCTVCGMAFVSPGELRRHHSKHTGERPFLCTICAKSFTRMQYLREHMHQHMGMKPYVCTFKDCGSSYPDVSSYCRHIKKHMKDTNKEAITFVMEKQDDPSSMVYLVQTSEGNLEHVSNAVDIAPRVDQVQVKMETNITNPQVADNGASQSDKQPEHVLYKLDNGQTIMYINTEEGEQTMVQIQDVPEGQTQAENTIEVYNERHVQTVQTVTSMANTANSFIPNLDPNQKIVFLDSGGITDGEQVGTGTANIDGATNSIELAIPSGSEIPPSQQPCTQVAMNHGGVMYIDSTAVQGQSEEVHILDTQETVASEALMHLLASGGWKPQNQT